MQSENFDKKIRDLLSQRPPGNDNPQWDKMGPLLDKHMPEEKKDRRRIIFILFTFLLLGGGAFFIWQNNNGDKKNISAIESKNDKPGSVLNETPENKSGNSVSDTKKPETGTTIEQKQNDNTSNQVNPKQETTKIPEANGITSHLASDPESTNTGSTTINEQIVKKTKKNSPGERQVVKNPKTTKSVTDKTAKEQASNPVEDISTKVSEPITDDKQVGSKEPEQQKTPIENKITEQKQEPKGSQPVTAKTSIIKKQKDKRSFFDNLFFSISAGADLSTIGVSDVGTVKPVYGAGIGYRISNRFSVRTGFYSARKVYDADPKDYHPPSNFWTYYPNLKNIEANCKVYEIPVTVDFTFNKSKKQNWFASAGASSLIMKEEVYDYYFKPNSSPTYITYTRKFENQNKHYFSVLNLSGGYRRNLNKNFSLQAEPYMKIAMNGIGFGKVKLNSGGVLVSAIVKPFAKK